MLNRPRRRDNGPVLRLSAALLVAVAAASVALATGAAATRPTRVEVYATGLYNPKGMAFLEGALYVAESGKPGDVDVPLPVNFGGKGPIGRNGRVSRIEAKGKRRDFVTGLPNIGLYGGVEMLGAASVTVLGNRLWELAAGHMTVSPALSLMDRDGTLTQVADVGEFNEDHPPPPSNGDAVPRGNPFDVVAYAGNFYVSDGNYNSVLKVTPAGKISLLAQWERSPVTVGMAAGPDGNLYVAQFSPAPYTPGTGRIDRVSPAGKVTEGVVRGLTTPIDVAFARDGTMYVLQYAAEYSAKKLRYAPFGGKVLRVARDGSAQPVVTNLVFPTALTFGPDGALFVSNFGNESNEGQGLILRVTLGTGSVRAPGVPAHAEKGSYVAPRRTPQPATKAGRLAKKITIVEPAVVDQWGYDPSSVTVNVGDTVVFTNDGGAPHTATAVEGEFDTGLLKQGESAVVRFDEPGRYLYLCSPHPWMKATIVVTGERAAAPGKAARGRFAEEDSPTINPLLAIAVVGLILAAAFAGGFAVRRRPQSSRGGADS